jgi:hypothetical protein
MSCFEDSVISPELVEMARDVSDLEPTREDLAAAYALFLARRGELELAWEAYHERFEPVSHAYMLKHKFRRMLGRTVGSDPFQESETAAP